MLNKSNILFTVAAGVASMWVATNASAANQGFYIGGQLGGGTTHQPAISKSDIEEMRNELAQDSDSYTLKTSSKTAGLAGRLFAGYQFNPNFAAELGFTQFSNAENKVNATENIMGENIAINARQTVKAQAFDIVGKGIIPLQDGFSVYGKLGVAHISETASASASVSAAGQTEKVNIPHNTVNKLYPTFGAGVTYSLTQNLDTDLSWTRIQKVGDSAIPSTDFVGLGLTYHFG